MITLQFQPDVARALLQHLLVIETLRVWLHLHHPDQVPSEETPEDVATGIGLLRHAVALSITVASPGYSEADIAEAQRTLGLRGPLEGV